MNMTRKNKMSPDLAEFVLMVARICYRKDGITGVNEYGDKIGLSYSSCEECNTDTPTVDTKNDDFCAVCAHKKIYTKELF